MFDFTIINTIDFLSVYIIIYYALLAIKGTRATQVLSGLILLGALYIASMRLGLVMLYQLLDMFFSYSVLIFVILFQDEIKRALVNLVHSNFLTKEPEEMKNHLIEEISKACMFLTKKTLGALIVIEQQVGLKNLLNDSIKLEANVNAELLTSIFAPQSPIHDGAVIIRNEKIIGASVVLPLTKQEIDSELGTRHRAGLGLSDESDAIIIIVSEEQQEISIAHNGKLIRNLDPAGLKKELYRLMPARKDTQAKVNTI